MSDLVPKSDCDTKIANQAIETCMNQTAYSSFSQFTLLLNRSGKSINDFILAYPDDKKCLEPALKGIENDTDLPKLWGFGVAGRCTAVEIQIANLLEVLFPGRFAFVLFSLGNHRIMYCTKTGVIIDSSFPEGSVLSRGNEWIGHPGSDKQCKVSENGTKIETMREDSNGKASRFPYPVRAVLDFAAKPKLVVLFRSVGNDLLTYRSKMEWKLATKNEAKLKLLTEDKGYESVTTIVWRKGQESSPAAEAQCHQVVHNFVKDHGGPYGATQWNADLQSTHQALWKACNECLDCLPQVEPPEVK